jgi:glucan-binding YG repeat protein
MIAGRTERIGDAATGQYYTFDNSGALQGGRADQNPLGNLANTGWRQGLDANGNPGGGWYFYRSDGTQVKGGWELIGNGGSRWYYFNENGTMKTGWLKWNGDWYWLTTPNGGGDPRTTTTGQMVTGFRTIPTTPEGINAQKTYFFYSNGALNGKGWIKQNNKWYYLQDDGTVATGWFREGTTWYYLDPTSNPTGEMKTGYVTTLADGVTPIANPDGVVGPQSFNASGAWLGSGAVGGVSTAGTWGKDANGKWHYYNTDKVALTGWQNIGDKWYYLDPGSTPAGVMLTGFQNIGGERYYFNSDGVLQGGWQLLSGVWYYFNPSHNGSFGVMLKGWQLIDNKWYYLDPATGACQVGWIENPTGSNTWYYLNSANEGIYGAMHDGGWLQVGTKHFWLNPNHDGTYGRQMQGWQNIDGIWYYFQESTNPAEGWMVTGRRQIAGKWYYFDSNGHMLANTTIDGHTYGPDGAEI